MRSLSLYMKMILPLSVLLLASCHETETLQEEDYVSVAAASTKGTPVTSVPSTFPVWGYVWPEAEAMGKPNWMCGEDFIQDGPVWRSTYRHANIPAGYMMRLWAMWPMDAPGVSGLPLAASAGTPSFSYDVPTDVADHKDLLVAWSEIFDIQPATFPLVMRHALSCILFKTSTENVPACTIKSVSIGPLASSGTYTEGSAWSALTGSDHYLIVVNQPFAVTDIDMRVGTEAQTMIVLPQTLPAEAQVSVDYRLDGETTDRTISASVAGLELGMGYKTVIRLILPTPSPSDEPGTLGIEATVQPWDGGQEFTATL